MARNDPQINLRVPLDLKIKLEGASTLNHRSLNAEVVARLEDSFGSFNGTIRIVLTADKTAEAQNFSDALRVFHKYLGEFNASLLVDFEKSGE